MKVAAISKAVLAAAIAAAVVFPVSTSAQEWRFNFGEDNFRFERDDSRGNDGLRARCSYYAQIAVVQAENNRRFNCGFRGAAWNDNAREHFRWCRFVRRETTARANLDRALDLQRCFDRLGDFDEERR